MRLRSWIKLYLLFIVAHWPVVGKIDRMSIVTPDTPCAVLSWQQQTPVYGTATVAKTWFLLEYPGPWTAKAPDGNQLPAEVNAWLQNLTAQIPQSRLQFIKRPTASAVGGLVFYTATAGHLYRYQLSHYADLLSLDWATLTHPAQQSQEQLLLVCTNGKRDRCCGQFGAAAFRLLATYLQEHPAASPESVWMTTHLGGHRFAATLVFLPAGLSYGLVQPEEIKVLVQTHRRGELMLARYRGRNGYAKPIQAAEFFLYQATGATRQDVFTWVDAAATGPDTWQIQFHQPDNHTRHTVNVTVHTSATPVLVSCSPAKWEVDELYWGKVSSEQ